MRTRTTFRDADLTVGSSCEIYVYGPQTAIAYEQVMSLPIRHRYEYCRAAIRYLVRELLVCYSPEDAVRIFHETFPHYREYRQSYVTSDVYRAGYKTLREAADKDSDDYFEAVDTGREPPFQPCTTPKEAYERYRLAV